MTGSDVPTWLVELLKQLPAEWALIGLMGWAMWRYRGPRDHPPDPMHTRVAELERWRAEMDEQKLGRRVDFLEWEARKDK